jgi:predicted ATPase
VLVLEDLHWAEPPFLDLVRETVETVAGAIVVLATGRPQLAERAPLFLASAPNRVVLHLQALPAHEGELLAAELLGPRSLPDDVVERILRHAGGNPLFLEETIHVLDESGLLDEPDALAAGGTLPVPATLQALIGSRLDHLPPGEKRLLQLAAVAGDVFSPAVLEHLDPGAGDVVEGLAALEQRDLVRAADDVRSPRARRHAFKHVLIKEVAYRQVPKRRRAELHLRAADWLEEAGSGDEYVELVAYHLERSCTLTREVVTSTVEPPVDAAVDALRRAAEKARRHEGLREAQAFYNRALAVLGDADRPKAIELQLALASVLVGLGELQDATSQLTAVAPLAEEAGRRDLLCRARLTLGNIAFRQGQAGDAETHLREAESLATAVGDRELEIRAIYEAATNRAWFDGADTSAIADLSRALARADEVDDRALRIEGHMRIATLLANNGRLAEAEEHFESCRRLAAEQSSFADEAKATTLLAFVKYHRGDAVAAERLALQAGEWLSRTGERLPYLQNLRELAVCALARGDAAAAEERLREALAHAQASDGWMVAELSRYLVEALVQQGRIAEARELVLASDSAVPPEDVTARATLLVARATVATAEGERQEALASWSEATRLHEAQRLDVDLPAIRRAYASALARFGDVPGARAQLELARETLSRIGADSAAAAVEADLATLGLRVAGRLSA